MAEQKEKTLNTRIVLRNDSSANWLQHQGQVLMSGEVGIEFLTNGKVKMKVGDGSTAWGELPYFGGNDAHVFEVTATEGDNDLDKINEAVGNTELVVGDSAIVKRAFVDGKISHTAYVYDGVWKAMDGNYNASNVYFDNDLQTTAPIGNIGLNNGQATIPAAGKNLNEVWQKIFVKEKDPAVTQPSASFDPVDVKYLEIGSEGTSSVTLKFNDGNYEYGYDRGEGVVNNGSTGASATAYHISYDGQTFNVPTQSISSGTKTAKASMSASGSINYSAGYNPVNNVGAQKANLKINSGSKSAKDIELFRWYVPMYHGFKYADATIADPSKITNAEVKALTAITGLTAYNQTVPSTSTANKSWMQYFVAVPANYKKNISGAKDGNNLTLGVAKANDVTINFNGTSVVYNVWYINNAAAYDTLKVELTW